MSVRLHDRPSEEKKAERKGEGRKKRRLKKEGQKMALQLFSLWRRVCLCVATLAMESYISYQEIFMLPMLQRVRVPIVLISLPGTISSVVGIFFIPLLGWASDRFARSTCCGQKRPYAILTLALTVVGVSVLIGVNVASLHGLPDDVVKSPQMQDDSGSATDRPLPTTADTDMKEIGRSVPYSNYSVFDRMRGADSKWTTLSPQDPKSEKRKPSTRKKNVDKDWLSSEMPYSFTVLNLTVDDDAAQTISGTTKVSPTRTPTTFAGSTASVSTSTSNSGSAGSAYLSPLGFFGILGFALSDIGYDSSMSTFEAYMIAVTPPSQHDNVFVMGTLIGAVGGCITSLLGFVDLSFVFPRGRAVLDKGVAQCLVQAAILWVSLLVFGACSLLTGSEGRQIEVPSPSVSKDEFIDDFQREICDTSPENRNRNSDPKLTDSIELQHEKSPLLHLDSTRPWKKRLFLCVMTFFGLCTNYAYFIYITNYVAEVIYKGNPDGEAGSDAYKNYSEGVHIASLGMPMFYCVFLAFNLLHNKILYKVGLRAEYLGASLGCCVLMLTLAFTDNVVVFFANAVTMAVFRSAVYTIPFMLSNNYVQRDLNEFKNESEGGSHSSQSGVAIASIAAMIPASYCLVSLVMGPLMDATGYPGTPIFFASASCMLGALSTWFVLFE